MDQLNIFYFIENDKFCFDDDINTLVDMIEEIINPAIDKRIFNADCSKKFSIWRHVPKYGYRLEMAWSFNFEIERDYFTYSKKPLYAQEINKLNFDTIFEFCEKRNIELSILPTPFLLLISTRFLDKRKNLR